MYHILDLNTEAERILYKMYVCTRPVYIQKGRHYVCKDSLTKFLDIEREISLRLDVAKFPGQVSKLIILWMVLKVNMNGKGDL